jgi:hypothetical protein
VSVVIKILFVLLILCTAALVAVGIGVLLRVRRHLNEEHTEGQAEQEVKPSDESAAPGNENP